MEKSVTWANVDAEARKRGEQTGLDTLVVHAVNLPGLDMHGLALGNMSDALWVERAQVLHGCRQLVL